MGRIRSLRNRLALFFGLIVSCAILVVYLAVVPPLEGQLREQKLDALQEAAVVHVKPLADDRRPAACPSRRSSGG